MTSTSIVAEGQLGDGSTIEVRAEDGTGLIRIWIDGTEVHAHKYIQIAEGDEPELRWPKVYVVKDITASADSGFSLLFDEKSVAILLSCSPHKVSSAYIPVGELTKKDPVEAVAQRLYEQTTSLPLGPWSKIPKKYRDAYRDEAHRYLEAALKAFDENQS